MHICAVLYRDTEVATAREICTQLQHDKSIMTMALHQ